MQSLFSIRKSIFGFVCMFSLILLLSSCDETEIVEIPILDEVVIYVKKDTVGNFGASGYINEEIKEYEGCNFCFDCGDTGDKMGIQIGKFEWFENTTWAHRQVITIENLDMNFVLNDTVFLDNDHDANNSWVYNIYEDGYQLGECYDIEHSADSRSWLVITEHYESIGMIAGTINANYIISDLCSDLQEPTSSDKIVLRDFWFRAGIIE